MLPLALLSEVLCAPPPPRVPNCTGRNIGSRTETALLKEAFACRKPPILTLPYVPVWHTGPRSFCPTGQVGSRGLQSNADGWTGGGYFSARLLLPPGIWLCNTFGRWEWSGKSSEGEQEGCPLLILLMQGQQALLGSIREQTWQHGLRCILSTHHAPTSLPAPRVAQTPLPNLCCFVKRGPWPPLCEPHLRLQHYNPPSPAELVAGPRFSRLRAEP